MFLCNSPEIDWSPIQSVLHHLPCDSQNRPQPDHNSELDMQKKIDGLSISVFFRPQIHNEHNLPSFKRLSCCVYACFSLAVFCFY